MRQGQHAASRHRHSVNGLGIQEGRDGDIDEVGAASGVPLSDHRSASIPLVVLDVDRVQPWSQVHQARRLGGGLKVIVVHDGIAVDIKHAAIIAGRCKVDRH